MKFRMPTLHRIDSPVPSTGLSGPSRVVGLLDSCRPSNIAGFVMAIVVDSVQCQRRLVWARADVSNKRRETRSPLLAYVNASTTVVLVMTISWVMAPLIHRSPDAVFSRVAKSVGFVTPESNAATGLRESLSEIPDKHFALGSTGTSTSQMPDSVSRLSFGDHGPKTNASTRRNGSE